MLCKFSKGGAEEVAAAWGGVERRWGRGQWGPEAGGGGGVNM